MERVHGATLVDNVDRTHSFWKRVGSGDGCWLWEGPVLANGYGTARLDNVKTTAHRIAFRLSRDMVEIGSGRVVMHRCDVRLCCRPSHLELGTYSDNTQDCIAKGRWACRNSTRVSNRPMPMAMAEEIARMLDEGHVLVKLADEVGYDQTTLRHIKYRRGRFAGIHRPHPLIKLVR